MSKYKVIDTALHFVNGKLYVTETQMQDGKASFYPCTGGACSLPFTDDSGEEAEA